MTDEGRDFIIDLINRYREKVWEISESSDEEEGIIHAVLNGEKLTAREIDKVLYLAQNGNPTISVEYRR